MKIFDCIQGTPQWASLRCGVVSASNFNKILTPTGKASTQATDYMHQLLAEFVVGHPFEGPKTPWMERGSELEDEAVKAYAFATDTDPEAVGFITNDAGTVGVSPDRLVGDKGLLEIKCPSPHTHVGYMLTGSVEDEYTPQLQGQLWLTERESVDIVSYHPELPVVIIKVKRDEEYIAKLSAAVNHFLDKMLTARLDLEKRYGPFRRYVQSPVDPHPFGVTDADVDAIWAESQRLQQMEVTH